MSPLQRQLVGQLRSAYYDSGLTYLQISVRAEMAESTVVRALNYGRVGVVTLMRLCAVLNHHVAILPATSESARKSISA